MVRIKFSVSPGGVVGIKVGLCEGVVIVDVQDLRLSGIVPRVQSEDGIGNGIEKGFDLRFCVEMGMGDHCRHHGG